MGLPSLPAPAVGTTIGALVGLLGIVWAFVVEVSTEVGAGACVAVTSDGCPGALLVVDSPKDTVEVACWVSVTTTVVSLSVDTAEFEGEIVVSVAVVVGD
jgi:hypothetical protein